MALRISDVEGKFTFLRVLGTGSFSVVSDVEFVMRSNGETARMALKWGFVTSSSGSTIQEHANTLRVIEWDYTPKSVGYIRHDTETFYVDDLFSNRDEAATEIRQALAGRDFGLRRDGTLNRARQFVLLLPRFDGDLDQLTPQTADLPLIDQALQWLCEKMAAEGFDHADLHPRNLLACVGEDGLFTDVILGDWGSAVEYPNVNLDALLRKKAELMEYFERRAGVRRRQE